MTDRMTKVPTHLLRRMDPQHRARAIANATLLDATKIAAKFLELVDWRSGFSRVEDGEATAAMMADETRYSLPVCVEALRRLVDADQAVSTITGGHVWYRIPSPEDF